MFAMTIHHDDDEDYDQPELASAGGVTAPLTHAPVYTVQASSTVIMTVIRVDNASYQLYAISGGTWDLVGLYDLYVDALANIDVWCQYLAAGGTLAAWRRDNRHGVQPNTMLQRTNHEIGSIK